MITADEISNNPDIETWLADDQYSADVYALHTGDEAICSAYFVELSSKQPESAIEQFVTLWKAYSIRTYNEEGDASSSPAEHLPKLIEEFGYVADYFSPEQYDDSHRERNNHILDKVEELITNASASNMQASATPGVFKNGKACNPEVISEIRKKLNACTKGIVPLNDWSEYDVVLVGDNTMYLFTWATYA